MLLLILFHLGHVHIWDSQCIKHLMSLFIVQYILSICMRLDQFKCGGNILDNFHRSRPPKSFEYTCTQSFHILFHLRSKIFLVDIVHINHLVTAFICWYMDLVHISYHHLKFFHIWHNLYIIHLLIASIGEYIFQKCI